LKTFKSFIGFVGAVTLLLGIIYLSVWMHYSIIKYAADDLIDERVKKECLLK